jgi:hypothetical protein
MLTELAIVKRNNAHEDLLFKQSGHQIKRSRRPRLSNFAGRPWRRQRKEMRAKVINVAQAPVTPEATLLLV